jgi:hypothetical protein
MLQAGIPAILEPLAGEAHGLPSCCGPLLRQQSGWFLYDLMDLAHAAGQPAAAGRASERQLRALRSQYGRALR